MLENSEPAADFAASPDGYERLWTPHRMVYIESGQQPSDADCPFCSGPRTTDEESLIVARGDQSFVVLNLYPYNTGHLLVCPYRHFDTYDKATEQEVLEIGHMTQVAMRVLKDAVGASGFNIGMNQGQVAGAGIAGHLHQHIVPRWPHDSNFFPIVAQTKAMPRLLGEVRQQIADLWPTA